MTINLIGRGTRDFELKTSPKGIIYAKFGLAVNDGFGKGQKTLYFECTAFDKEAERIKKAKAKKSSLITMWILLPPLRSEEGLYV